MVSVQLGASCFSQFAALTQPIVCWALGCKGRNKRPFTSEDCPLYFAAILWNQNFGREKIGARILYPLFPCFFLKIMCSERSLKLTPYVHFTLKQSLLVRTMALGKPA